MLDIYIIIYDIRKISHIKTFAARRIKRNFFIPLTSSILTHLSCGLMSMFDDWASSGFGTCTREWLQFSSSSTVTRRPSKTLQSAFTGWSSVEDDAPSPWHSRHLSLDWVVAFFSESRGFLNNLFSDFFFDYRILPARDL